jgi:hypothetical protein
VVVDDLDAACRQLLTPPFVLTAGGLHAGMTWAARAMVGDRAGPLREPLAIKQQQHAGPDPEREAVVPARHEGQAEHLAVEAPDGLPSPAVVVEHRFEHSDESGRLRGHGCRGHGPGARGETLDGRRASASAASASTTDVGRGRGWALRISENTVAGAPWRGAARKRRAARTGQLAHRGVDRQHVLFCFITASPRGSLTRSIREA